MTGWVVAAVLLVLLLSALVGAYNMIESLRKSVDNAHAEHLGCHETVIDVLTTASIRTDATALLQAADAYDSFMELGNLRRLQEQYRPGGPSVPALWLRDRADKMVGGTP